MTNIPSLIERPLSLLANAALSEGTKTIHLKVKPEAWAWLDQAAREVNSVWNYANATAEKALRTYHGKGKWLSKYDLDKLTAGCGEHFDRIGSDVVQCVNAEFTNKRSQFRKARLSWRKSGGSKRSLGWIPFKSANISFKEKLAIGVTMPRLSAKRRGETAQDFSLRKEIHAEKIAALPRRRAICFMGKTIRLFNVDRLFDARSAAGYIRQGNFAQNSLGEWFVNIVVTHHEAQLIPLIGTTSGIGMDPGFLATVSDSKGGKLKAARFYREVETKISSLQKRGHKKQSKRVHLKVKNTRLDAQCKDIRQKVDNYGFLFIGNANVRAMSQSLHFGKSVGDAAVGQYRTLLQSVGHRAGRTVLVIDERFTTQVCSNCDQRTGPKGLRQLAVREWTCTNCKTVHDRDHNSAIIIEQRG
jgi:putative transposase